MNEISFYNSILSVIENNERIKVPGAGYEVIEKLKVILAEKEVRSFYKITKMTILFERFYQLLPDNEIKAQLLQLRLQRWRNHFGTPTLAFLLSYQRQIAENHEFNFDFEGEVDSVNHVVVNKHALQNIEMPDRSETQGALIKTHNPVGGFTTIPSDPYSKKFLSYVEEIAQCGGKVLEVGTAFGAASLEALSLGATVYCNDIDPKNLAVVCKRYHDGHGYNLDASTGDSNKLICVPGSFPDELSGLPKNSFDAILICRVLHFFKGEIIEKSIRQMGELLKPGGKLFIVCETPYMKNWQSFIPEYERRVAQDVEWPGEMTNQAEYENAGYAATLPLLMNFMNKDVIDRTINRSGLFDIEHSSYINRAGQFPEDLLLDGRESVGAVAVKK